MHGPEESELRIGLRVVLTVNLEVRQLAELELGLHLGEFLVRVSAVLEGYFSVREEHPGLLSSASNVKVVNLNTHFQKIFAFLIIIFSYFYTAITIPTNKMADDLKRSGGFIPGIRPGKDTGDLLDRILSLITFPGSLFLALVAILPAIVVKFGLTQSWALFYGGTSLLIMVGVAIDTIQQINSHLLNRHYDGLMKKGTKRKSIA